MDSAAASRERPKLETNSEKRSHSETNLIGLGTKGDWIDLFKTTTTTGEFEENDDNNIINKQNHLLPKNENLKPTKKSSSKLGRAPNERNSISNLPFNDIVTSNERLTMLEEPIIGQSASLPARGAMPISSTDRLKANQSSSSKATKQQSLDDQIQIWSQLEQNNNYNNNNTSKQQTSNQAAMSDQQTLLSPLNVPDSNNGQQILILTFFGGFVSLLLFLLVALILYNWFFARRRRRRQTSGKWCSRMWFMPRAKAHHLNAPACCEDSPGKMSSILTNENSPCVSGERVQLVERRPIKSNLEVRNQEAAGKRLLSSVDDDDDDDDDEHGIVSEAHLGDHAMISTTMTTSENHPETDEKGSSTMVILRRKLANNSFFVSSRPKVRLIRQCMRKFIDDEAKEMRAKEANGPQATIKSSWRNRFYLGRNCDNARCRDEEVDRSDSMPPNKTDTNNEDAVLSETVAVQCCSIENKQLNNDDPADRRSDNAEIADERASQNLVMTSSSSTYQQEFHEKLELVDDLDEQATSTNAKYPHSPTILNDTCSSTSLFTPSPIVLADSSAQASQQSNGPSWPFNPLTDWHQLRSKAGQKDLFGIRNEELYQRSKSHTPMQCLDSTSASQVYRPCCASVSPSALNQKAGQEQICCQPQQQQHQLTYQTTSNYINKARIMDTHPQLRAGSSLYPDGNSERPSPVNPNEYGSKCLSNHLRRQYENYYDDEHDEVYRRLTANIGMEFGIGFDHHHHHHRHSVNSLEYCNVKDADAHLNNLLHPESSCEASACSQHRHHAQLDEQHPLLVPPDLSGHQVNNLTDVLHIQQQPQQYPPQAQQMESCPCCRPRLAAPFTSNPMSFLKTCTNSNKSPFNHTQRQRSCSDQHQIPASNKNGYLFKNDGGSAGELLTSSGSTSLGGSDSGFMQSSQIINSIMRQPVVCGDPLCACQLAEFDGSPGSAQVQLPTNQQQAGAPAMSILIQQPSMATPPPPPQPIPLQQSSIDIDTESSAQLATANKKQLSLIATTNGDENYEQNSGTDHSSSINNTLIKNNNNEGFLTRAPPPSGSKSTSPTAIRPRWNYRRNPMNQKRHTDINGCAPVHSSNLISRRVSIAGDQMSVKALPSPINLRDAPSSQAIKQERPVLQHRASVASDGGWLPETPINQALRFNPNQHYYYNQQQQLQGNNQDLPQTADYSHRPSDASLYDTQSCAVKSSYSSSAGSSSGIGISGSTCATNTPTTSTFPYPSFAANFKMDQFGYDELASRFNLAKAQAATLCNAYPMHHFTHSNPYQANQMNQMTAQQLMVDLPTTQNGLYQIPAATSRKYSLPVQLESQSAERLSPTHQANRLLFEKNLQRVDSVNLSLLPQTHYQQNAATNLPGSVVAAHLIGQNRLDNEGNQRSAEQRRLFETSRRSSQTITRQSSFWLEDDSAVSIFSLATSGVAGLQSVDGSQLDVNNLQLEEKDFNDQQACQQSDEPAQRRGSHQRPSISSLVQSGDSIESVKQRPMTTAAAIDDAIEPDQPIQAVPGDELTEIDSKNSNVDASDKPKQSNMTAEKRNSYLQRGGIAHLRNRLSSSSITSSTASSPSPDFSRPSDRVLGIAPKSSSISKRQTFGKLRAGRRYGRSGGSFGSNTGTDGSRRTKAAAHQHSAPSSTSKLLQDSEDASSDNAIDQAKQYFNEKQDGNLNDCAFTSK